MNRTVSEVDGPPVRRNLVVLLTPELSDSVVDDPPQVSILIDAAKKVVPAA